MQKIYSEREAQKWFLENRSGSVLCIKHGRYIEAITYVEAEAFFRADEPSGQLLVSHLEDLKGSAAYALFLESHKVIYEHVPAVDDPAIYILGHEARSAHYLMCRFFKTYGTWKYEIEFTVTLAEEVMIELMKHIK